MGAAFKAFFLFWTTLLHAANEAASAVDAICTIGHEQATATLNEHRAQTVADLAKLKAELALDAPVVVIGNSKAVA